MPQLLICNAHILTLDQRRPTVSALAIEGDRILATGTRDEVAAVVPDAQILDLGGKTVVPGFIDSHVHFTWTGIRRFALGLDEAKSADDALALVNDQAA